MITKYLKISVLLLSIIFYSCSSDSKDINPLDSDITPPSLEISFTGMPNINAGDVIVVSQQLEIKIKAEDANGIQKIDVFIDEQKVGEDTSAPFAITVDLSKFSSKTAKGNFQDYTLKIVATDNAGNISSKEQVINVDNEIPVISEVSVEKDMVLHGAVNPITFNVIDNEAIAKVNVYINNMLVSEIMEEGALESNVDTSNLSEGQSTLKIEAIDLADNKVSFEVNFITDNTGPEISLESFTEGMVIDELISLAPNVADAYSDVASVEIKLNDESLLLTEESSEVNYDFDPENFGVGEATIAITAIDSVGNRSSLEIPVNIYRRLITINIPENRINPAIVFPVVFVSQMDGSLVVSKEILTSDRQIILSVPEEFDLTTEFMLSFYLQDNGNMAGISTHQNLTRSNPKVLNLAEPVRRVESGSGTVVSTVNFLSNDVLIGNSGGSSGLFRSLNDAVSGYDVFLNTSENNLNISSSTTSQNANPFNSYYVYDLFSSKYLFIPNPIDENFVLDKVNLSDVNLESRELLVNSPNALSNTTAVLSIYGAIAQEEETFNKYHQIYNFNRGGLLDSPMPYNLNTSFFSYRHALQFGDYFTERNGPPINNYEIPNVTFDYTFLSNQINLSVQGTDHVVGRAQCIDFDNLTYDWYITFKSKDSSTIIIPELPGNIAHPVATAHKNGNIKVESVELINYESIITYDDYIQKVVKNQTNVLDATDWYQLIYSSRTGNFNIPNRDFVFQ